MKIGLIITAYNRPFELRRCLESLKHAILPSDLLICITDDASKDDETIKLIENFNINGVNINKVFNRFNLGIKKCLTLGINFLFRNQCDVVINLDGDAIVHEQFFNRLIDLHLKFPRQLVSGFNSSSHRHPVVTKNAEYVKKSNAGGINFVFTKDIYNKFLIPALSKPHGNWDTITSNMMFQRGLPIVCAAPSVVQHIAETSTLGHHDRPDTAADFEYESSYDDAKVTKIIPLQAFGLGDIIFSMTIARKYWQKEAEVVWPVMPHFVEGLQRAYPDIKFIDWRSASDIDWERKETRVTLNGTKIIPLRWSYVITHQAMFDCMKSKYGMFGLDWRMWREQAMWTRDTEKEQELLQKINPTGEKFNIINRFFKSESEKSVAIQYPKNGARNIEMSTLDGFSLFDWARAFELAEEIHTVSTSNLYLLELLNIPAHIYIRRPDEKSHANYEYILEQKHFLHN